MYSRLITEINLMLLSHHNMALENKSTICIAILDLIKKINEAELELEFYLINQ